MRQQPTIEQLFDSLIKIKLLKLFLRNPETSFTASEAAKKIGCAAAGAKRHIFKLREIGFLSQRGNKNKKAKFALNRNFVLYPELENLLSKLIPVPFERLKKQIKGLGNVRLAIISGVFLNEKASRLDFLLVGEKINQRKLNNFIKKTEQHIGREIVFVVFNNKEFNYRLDVRDRFVRDILEGRHEKLLQRIKL